jgi:hypothetical protein
MDYQNLWLSLAKMFHTDPCPGHPPGSPMDCWHCKAIVIMVREAHTPGSTDPDGINRLLR